MLRGQLKWNAIALSSGRPAGFERYARRAIELGDELVEQAQELGSFRPGERRQNLVLRATRGFGETREHALARLGERKRSPPFVLSANSAPDQAFVLELVEHHARGRAIETQQLCQRDLIDA